MKIYKHEGKGFYIGSCVIVVADTIEMAKILIENELFRMGLSDEKAEPIEIDIRDNIVYSYNGDY
jgi:hypothetical protein